MEDIRSICPACVDKRIEKTQVDIAKKLDGASFVKKCFVDEDFREHMWVKIHDIDFENKLIKGLLDNKPVRVKNIKLFDPVKVEFDEIEDIIL